MVSLNVFGGFRRPTTSGGAAVEPFITSTIDVITIAGGEINDELICIIQRGRYNLFVVCLGAVCWAIWKTGNYVCFEKKIIHHPESVVFLLCSCST